MMVAFSRSRKPMRPISCESERRMPGTSFGEDLGRPLLHLGGDRRKHRTDGRRA